MDFEIGDRICKVRGINSGKSGTIRSVLPNGTVGVVFDGEKTVRYCDPGNCAKPTMIPVATNAAFKVGDRVKIRNIPAKTGIVTDVDNDGDVKIKGLGMDYEIMWVKKEFVSKAANSTTKNAKFRKGDVVYLGGVEKMEVMAPTDAHGWTKCKYLEGSRKGMVIDMPTPELKSAKNASAANASVNETSYNADRRHGRDLMAKHMGTGFVQLFEREKGGSSWKKLIDDAKKALASRDAADIEAYIMSIVRNSEAEDSVTNAKIEVDGSKLKFTDKTGKWHGPFKNWDELEREMGKYGISLNYETVANAATDAEFEKIKAMGKTAGDKYFRDNYQSFIDKYGFKDALELGKRISRIKYKPIKKGRFSGKGPDGMTYYVDYTSDRWFAKKYGKDGTNVTAIQIQGPWVKDPNGKDRRHILYLYEGGSESIHPANPAVAQLVKQIMRGPDVLKQDAADYAWNEEVTSSNPVVANALKAARNDAIDLGKQWKVGDIAYIFGVQKVVVVSPKDARGYTRVKYLDGARKGKVEVFDDMSLKTTRS